MNDLTLLMTGVGAEGVYGVIKCLQANSERKIRIIGVDADSEVASRYFVDEFYQAPLRHTPAFIPFVMDLVERLNIDVLWPIPTEELEMFSALKGELAHQGVRVMVSDLEGLQIANNKYKLYQFLADNHHPCQSRFAKVDSWDTFLAQAHHIGYPHEPVCMRKPVSAGARGFRILDDQANHLDILLNKNPGSTVTSFEHVQRILENVEPFPELILQEYLPGDEYDVDVLAHQGESLAVIPRLNHRMLWGASSLCQTENHAQIIEYSRDIVRRLNLTYIINLSFKMSPQDEPKLIEINPRVPSSIAITHASGINYPYLSLKLAFNEMFQIPDVSWDVRMIRYWDEIFTKSSDQPLQYPLTLPNLQFTPL